MFAQFVWKMPLPIVLWIMMSTSLEQVKHVVGLPAPTTSQVTHSPNTVMKIINKFTLSQTQAIQSPLQAPLAANEVSLPLSEVISELDNRMTNLSPLLSPNENHSSKKELHLLLRDSKTLDSRTNVEQTKHTFSLRKHILPPKELVAPQKFVKNLLALSHDSTKNTIENRIDKVPLSDEYINAQGKTKNTNFKRYNGHQENYITPNSEQGVKNKRFVTVSNFPFCTEDVILGKNQSSDYVFSPIVPLVNDYFMNTSVLLSCLEAEDNRLPDNVLPVLYDVFLKVFHWGNATFRGHVLLHFQALSDSDVFILHSSHLHVKTENIKITQVSPSDIELHVVDSILLPEKEMLAIAVSPPLKTGYFYNVTIHFEGVISDEEYGLYRLPYSFNGEKRWIALTQLQTIFARRLFPCMDEPRFKASFILRIARPTNSTALANTALVSTTTINGESDWVVDEFAATPPMATYIIAFAIMDFEHLSVKGPGITFSVWTRPGKLPFVLYILESLARVLYFFESYLGVKYPLSKLDLVAVPTQYSRAMENWGLVAMQEAAVHRTWDSSFEDKILTLKIMSHELAHMWFGNLVTPGWWDSVWLSEGFATFLSTKGTESVLDGLYSEDGFVSHEQRLAFSLDIAPDPKPIYHQVRHNETFAIFDDLTYNKGASIVRMMSHFITTNLFQKGMKNYLNERKYSWATNYDFLESVTKTVESCSQSNLNVSQVMQTWLEKPGYPVVNASKNKNGSLSVTQNVFSYRGQYNVSSPYHWWIPISIATQEGLNSPFATTPSFWLAAEASRIFPSRFLPHFNASSWYIINVERTGFYRVNYEERNWSMLAQQLRNNYEQIPIANRAQIVDDVFHLFCAEMVSYSVLEDVLSYVGQETSAFVWQILYGNGNLVYNPKHHPPNFYERKDLFSHLIDV